MRSVLRNPYTFPPTPKELEKHRSELHKHYSEIGLPKTEDETSQEILNYLEKFFIDGADDNTKSNDFSSACLFNSKRMIVFALFAITAAGASKATEHLSVAELCKDVSQIFFK